MDDEIRPKALMIPFDKFVILDILPPEQYKNTITKMRRYVEHGEEPDGLEPLEQMAFEAMRPFLNENVKTYQRAVLAHREAGRKGGRPKKPEDSQMVSDKNQMEPNGFSEKPTETNSPLKYKVQSTTDTKVSDITTTTTVVEHDLDADLSKIAQHFQEAFGDLPPSVGYKIKSWRETFSTEMILLAIDRAAEAGKRNWTYVDGTLRGWKRDGIKNPADVAASDEQWQNRQQQARTGSATGGRKPAERVDDQLTRVLANMDRKRGFEQ